MCISDDEYLKIVLRSRGVSNYIDDELFNWFILIYNGFKVIFHPYCVPYLFWASIS